MLYSQHNEQQIVTDYFSGFTGRFLDIGAGDGVTFSNTRRLAELGWAGICIESDPDSIVKFARNWEHQKVELFCGLILPENRAVEKFWWSNEYGISTASTEHMKRWSQYTTRTRYREILMPAITPAEFMTARPGPYDFISVDVEGVSASVLMKIDLKDVSMICVEHDSRQEVIVRYCHGFGLTHQLLHNAENLVLARPQRMEP